MNEWLVETCPQDCRRPPSHPSVPDPALGSPHDPPALVILAVSCTTVRQARRSCILGKFRGTTGLHARGPQREMGARESLGAVGVLGCLGNASETSASEVAPGLGWGGLGAPRPGRAVWAQRLGQGSLEGVLGGPGRPGLGLNRGQAVSTVWALGPGHSQSSFLIPGPVGVAGPWRSSAAATADALTVSWGAGASCQSPRGPWGLVWGPPKLVDP